MRDAILELNIGLLVKGKVSKDLNHGIAVGTACAYCAPKGTIIARRAVAVSGELTSVIYMTVPGNIDLVETIDKLCEMLYQDCIAVKLNARGYLIGPDAQAYGGIFNDAYWLSI